MKRLLPLVLLFSALSPLGAWSADRWVFQLFGGASHNFNLPLTVTQSGNPTLHVTGNYDSRSFEVPYYYAWRIGAWTGREAWELELVHNKLYLQDPPPEIQEFSISHGYNLLTANRAWERGRFIFRAGLGVVITHPENTIRNRSLPQDGGLSGGYYLSGPTAQVAAEKRFRLWKWLIGSLEAKLTATYAWVPVEGGHADVPNVAIHGLFGLGVDL